MDLYFAYGSNMSQEQLKSRCPDAQCEGAAKLPGYALEFPRGSKKRGCGVASLTEAPGSVVYGVLYKLTENDFKQLDRAEGVAVNAYTRRTIEVEGPNAQRQSAQTYIANPVESPPLPSREYIDLLIHGAIEHSLPPEYINSLRQIPVLDASSFE